MRFASRTRKFFTGRVPAAPHDPPIITPLPGAAGPKIAKERCSKMPKFRLKSKVSNLDGLPEAYRGAYEKRDGAFHLDPAKLEEIEFDDRAEMALAFRNEKVRAAALNAGVRADDVDDVVVVTAGRFDLDAQGNIVVLGDDRMPSGASVEDFFGKTFREQRPRYYAPTSDGGKSISRAAFGKMGAQEQATFMKEGGQLVD